MSVEYADGAESTVLSALRSATDVRAGSAELTALVDSWETAYHFSPLRLGLLAPLRLSPGRRAVDLGCGSGPLTRALGEAGLDVLGLEGVPLRAAAARERCRDLPNVRIETGALTDALSGGLGGGWHLALMCGLLEYSEQYAGGPVPVLREVAARLADDGAVAIAIENQLGLKYLLGGAEDHYGTSWVGLADYPGATPAPRTWTRETLAGLLAEAGLAAQRWLLPYPDYKLPRLVLDESAFDRDELVEKLVRDPISGAFGGDDAAVSGRILHRLAMDEGIAPLLAPSFLVIAARTEAGLAASVDPGLAWLISGDRRPAWRRVRRLDPDLTLHTVHRGPGAPGSWLRQQHLDAEPLRPGRPLDALLLDAMRTGDLAETGRLLGLWRDTCTARARALDGSLAGHPFLPRRAGVDVLPADHLDVHPGNLIVGPDGEVARVDLEWLAGDGVDAELVLLRALVELARDTVHGHCPHPWPHTTVHGVLTELCALAGLSGALARWPELVAAEAALQQEVTGRPAERIAAELENDALADRGGPLWRLPGGLGTLRAGEARLEAAGRQLADAADRERQLHAELDRQRTHIEDLTDRVTRAEHGWAQARAELDVKDDRIGKAFSDLSAAVSEATRAWSAHAASEESRAGAQAEADALRSRLSATRARLDALESSTLVRAAHRSLWPAGRIVRGVRDLVATRPGDEPDGLLRRLGRRAPGLTARLAGRYRRAAAPAREAGLHFDLPVPSSPVAVGAGQVVELTGWVTHAAVGVRSVTVLAGSRRVPADRGHHQPAVAASMRAAGVRTPDGSGIVVRIPVAAADAPGELPLTLSVVLDDGTELTRPLPPLTLVPALPVAPVEVSWPADGPRVAVCLASYRPDPVFLERQLESLRAQKHANWVCVICDDGSDADSLASIRSLVDGDRRFVLVANEENVGFYRNFERALALAPADADAIALCDQDDVWDPDKLDTLLDRLADPEVSLAYADMRLVDEHDAVLAPSSWTRRRNQWEDLDALLLLNTVTGAASLLRADVVRSVVLPFPPGTPSAFHDQWIAAAALAAGRVEFVDRPLHSYRQHGTAVTGWRDERLDADLPRRLGWLLLAGRGSAGLPAGKDAELEAVAEFELRRVAQFATVLLMRAWHRLPAGVRERVAELTRVDRDPAPLLARAVRAGGRRADTAGVERHLLAAALRRRALRGRRLRVPPLPPHPID